MTITLISSGILSYKGFERRDLAGFPSNALRQANDRLVPVLSDQGSNLGPLYPMASAQ